MTVLRMLTFSAVLLTPAAAYAYIGPGAGISAIGSLLTLVAVVLLTIVGFVWYPIKRLIKFRRKARGEAAKKDGTASS